MNKFLNNISQILLLSASLAIDLAIMPLRMIVNYIASIGIVFADIDTAEPAEEEEKPAEAETNNSQIGFKVGGYRDDAE